MYGSPDSYLGEMGLEMILATFGNAFLIHVITRSKRVSKQRVSPVQLLLLHTCVADLLYAFLPMGTGIIELEVLYKYDFDRWVCPVMKFLQVFPLYASPFLLVAISADRFQAICRPLAHYRAGRYRIPNVLAAIAWSLAFLCSIPQCYIWEKVRREGSFGNETLITVCQTIFPQQSNLTVPIKATRFWYIVSFNAVAWLLPSMIASIFYYRLCKTVWSSRVTDPLRDSSQQNTSGPTLKNQQTKCYVDGLRRNTLRRQTSEFDKKRMQTVRLTLTIVVCNFLLYAPYCIGNVIKALSESSISNKVLIYCMILGNLNSCVNPWIYILFNRSQIKKALFVTTAVPSSFVQSRYSEIGKTDSFKKLNNSALNRKALTPDYTKPLPSAKRLSMHDDMFQPRSNSDRCITEEEENYLNRSESLRPARL